jgi:hypothetical protein
MSVIVRTLFPPVIYETGRWEAIDMMITTLMEVIGSLRLESTPLDSVTRYAAIEDVARQIAELQEYRDAHPLEAGRHALPHQLE